MNKSTEPEIVDANLEGKGEPDNEENMEEEQEAGQHSILPQDTITTLLL